MKRTLTITLLLILFSFIALFLNADFMTHFEEWIYTKSVEPMSSPLTISVKTVTHAGDAVTVTAICLFLFVIPKLKKNFAVTITLTVAIAEIANLILKPIFARERPQILHLVAETSYSFPSGHAMASAAFYGCIALLVWQNISHRQTKIITALFCFIITFLIGLSRVYLGVHYITDVIGGWCLGLAIATAATNKKRAS